jgi:hypothetical protein
MRERIFPGVRSKSSSTACRPLNRPKNGRSKRGYFVPKPTSAWKRPGNYNQNNHPWTSPNTAPTSSRSNFRGADSREYSYRSRVALTRSGRSRRSTDCQTRNFHKAQHFRYPSRRTELPFQPPFTCRKTVTAISKQPGISSRRRNRNKQNHPNEVLNRIE